MEIEILDLKNNWKPFESWTYENGKYHHSDPPGGVSASALAAFAKDPAFLPPPPPPMQVTRRAAKTRAPRKKSQPQRADVKNARRIFNSLRPEDRQAYLRNPFALGDLFRNEEFPTEVRLEFDKLIRRMKK